MERFSAEHVAGFDEPVAPEKVRLDGKDAAPQLSGASYSELRRFWWLTARKCGVRLETRGAAPGRQRKTDA